MSHVFISYSKKNQKYARQLAEKLIQEGFDVWIDDRIDYGDSWERVIFKAIDECSAFVVIMTPESYESDWVLRECQYADRRKKPQFPVLLSGEEFPRYGFLQFADVRDGQLPPPNFYDKLAQHAPRKSRPGADVTERESSADADVEAPVHAPFGEHIPWGSSTEEPDITDLGEIRATGQRHMIPRPRLARAGFAVIGGVVLLVVMALLLSNPDSPLNVADNPSGTPTDTLATPTEDERTPIFNSLGATSAAETLQATTTFIPLGMTRLALTETAGVSVPTNTGTPTLTPTSLPAAISTPLNIGSGEIAFTSYRDGNAEIYLMNADGSNLINLTQNAALDVNPSWSPYGSQIAFMSDRDGNEEIYTMNADGSDPRNLTQNAAYDIAPAWSPDGSQIAFTSDRDGNREIYVMNFDGSDIHRLTNNETNDIHANWSPDGMQIAYSSGSDIYIINADGTNPRNLTQDAGENVDFSPAWSPDGRQIAFQHGSDIYIMDADGNNIRPLVDESSASGDPTWSPDGRFIAFSYQPDGLDDIYLMSVDGMDIRRLTDDSAFDQYPAWRPAPQS
jgi:hypothetical protein